MFVEKNEVLFWGYATKNGKRQFMTHESKLFVPLGAFDSSASESKNIENDFWGGWTMSRNLCLSVSRPGNQTGDVRYFTCQVNITLAEQARKDIQFHTLGDLRSISGLDQLDRAINSDIWSGIAFIRQHMPN